MMWQTLLFFCVALFGVSAISVGVLLWNIKKQRNAVSKAQRARIERLKQSIQIIAQSMQNGSCNLSEGVIRLKMLLAPMGLSLQTYPHMNQLYQVVMDMPTHEKRRELKRNERMRLDLQRESAEAECEQGILAELNQLMADVKNY